MTQKWIEREKKQREIFHSDSISEWLQGQKWTRLKPGSQNYVQVSHAGDRDPAIWIIIYYLLKHAVHKLKLELKQGLEPRYSEMGISRLTTTSFNNLFASLFAGPFIDCIIQSVTYPYTSLSIHFLIYIIAKYPPSKALLGWKRDPNSAPDWDQLRKAPNFRL